MCEPSKQPRRASLRQQCARLDVHELGREGKLKLGTRGCLFGTLRFEVAGGPTRLGACAHQTRDRRMTALPVHGLAGADRGMPVRQRQ